MIAVTDEKQKPFPEIYQEPLELLSRKMTVLCYCLNCGWSTEVDLKKVELISLKDLKQEMSCPTCNHKGLSLGVKINDT